MKKIKLILACILLCQTTTFSQKRKAKNNTPPQQLQDTSYHNFQWRNIGPFRGGRSVASAGVVDAPMTYYMGTTGGGIWKTVDDGINWKNVSDGFFKTGTVGAIGISESNPNIVVVGMGEHAARGVMTSMGDGVYKSTDAGKTWKHIGLDKTRHISDVIIHPNNPDLIYIAAQGAQYGGTKERGIYRSVDGGANWENVLFVNNTTGASSLSLDMNNPLILYAAMWDHKRYPWTMESGGKGSGLYKSTDGGSNWTKMEKGLPEEFGKAGVSVSRANSERVFAVIEAEDSKGGVYRSDNAGETWVQINKDRINIARSWYYMEIFADPQNENVVYVLNAPVTKSIDGGKTFKAMPTPHGDNHDLWINPKDNQKMINSNDGGANISNNGGISWSSQQNQPTSQFYRVITDNLVPYHVYGGQQDNSAIGIASRTNDAGIDWKDWYSVAGCESAYLAFDPDNPEIIYGGCYQGIIEKWSRNSAEGKSIKEYPEIALGNAPKDFKYRYNWNAPIISSPHDRNTIYHAGNVVFKTTDGGINWTAISPDLTRNDKSKQGPGGGPYTNEAAGGENYNTIMYLVESPHEKGVLYAGSDDGLVHITKDGGQEWTNITPPEIKEGIINSIEISSHDPGTAYITLMRYKFQDLKPYVFKTSDYGQSWTKIVDGITDEHTFVRVVREDPIIKGLLYAGTETGLYVSVNDGRMWQPFQLNLPVVPINDMVIQANDLVVATAGRSFWILDNLAPIQNSTTLQNTFMLVKPSDSYLLFGGSSDKPVPGLGENPKQGVQIDYFLTTDSDSLDLELQILKNGKLVRSITNKKDPEFKSWPGGPKKPSILSSKKGYNRFVWDFRKNSLPAVDKVFVYGDYSGSRVGPGTYTVKMILEGEEQEKQLTILANPKVQASQLDYDNQQAFLETIESTIASIHESVAQMRSAKTQLESYKALLKNNENAESLIQKGDSLITRINRWEQKLIQPKQKTFQDVINYNNQLNAELMHLKGFVDSSDPVVTSGAKERLDILLLQWKEFENKKLQLISRDMKEYESLYRSLEIPVIIMEHN